MRAFNQFVLKLLAVAFVLLIAQACASTGPSDPARSSRNEAGQAALEGMENAVLKDNDPNSPVLRTKPAN